MEDVIQENQASSNTVKLFLNTLYAMEEIRDIKLIRRVLNLNFCV